MKSNLKILPFITMNCVIGKSGQKLKNGEQTISIKFSQKGYKSVYRTLKISTKPEWFKNGVIQPNDEMYKYKNIAISNNIKLYYSILHDYIVEFNRNPTINQFLQYKESYVPKYITFNELCELFNNTSNRSKSTSGNYITLVNSLYEFDSKLLPCDFTIEKLDKYQNWMIKYKKLKHNTIMSRIKLLKALLNFAISKRLIDDNPIKDYKIQPMKSKQGHLEYKEVINIKDNLNEIENKLSKEHAHIARLFLFSCGTGLRFSDIQTLEKEHIENDWIHKIMIKTKQPVHTPLFLFNKLPLTILEYYKHDCSKFKKYLKCNATVNKKLKDIFIFCNIDYKKYNFTFHTARHTFATLLMENKNFETNSNKPLTKEQVSLLLGHTSIKETKTYIDMSNDMYKNQILNNVLNN